MGLVHGPSLMFSVVCLCESTEGVQQKGDFSAAYHNKRDVSALVPHGKSTQKPLNSVFLLSVGFHELADASRFEKLSLCAEVSILSQSLNCYF